MTELALQGKSQDLNSLLDGEMSSANPIINTTRADVQGNITTSASTAESFIRRKMGKYIRDYLSPTTLDGIGVGTNFLDITNKLSQILSQLASGNMYDVQHPLVQTSYTDHYPEIVHTFDREIELLDRMGDFILNINTISNMDMSKIIGGLQKAYNIVYNMRWNNYSITAWETLNEMDNFSDDTSNPPFPTFTSMYILNKILTSDDFDSLTISLYGRISNAINVIQNFSTFVSDNYSISTDEESGMSSVEISELFQGLPIMFSNLKIIYKHLKWMVKHVYEYSQIPDIVSQAEAVKIDIEGLGNDHPIYIIIDTIITDNIVNAFDYMYNKYFNDLIDGMDSDLQTLISSVSNKNDAFDFIKVAYEKMIAFKDSLLGICYCDPSMLLVDGSYTMCTSACSGMFGSMTTTGASGSPGYFQISTLTNVISTIDGIIEQSDFAIDTLGSWIDTLNIDTVHCVTLVRDFLEDFIFVDENANKFSTAISFSNSFGDTSQKQEYLGNFNILTDYFKTLLVCEECADCGDDTLCGEMNFEDGNLTTPDHFFHTKLYLDNIRAVNSSILYYHDSFYVSGEDPSIITSSVNIPILYKDFNMLYYSMLLKKYFTDFYQKMVDLDGLTGLMVMIYQDLTMMLAQIGIVQTIERKGLINPITILTDETKKLNNNLYWSHIALEEAKVNPENIDPRTGEMSDMLIQYDAWRKGTEYLHINKQIEQLTEKMTALEFD